MGSALQTYKTNEKLAVWTQRVQECRASGLKVAQWCEENGISKYTYYEWQRKVFAAAEEAHKAAEPEFVEIVCSNDGRAVASVVSKTGLMIDIFSTDALIEVLREC